MNVVLYVFGIMQMLIRIIMGPGMVAHSFKHASTKEAGDGGGVSLGMGMVQSQPDL